MRGFLGMILMGAAALSACGGGGQPSGPPPPPPAQAMLSLFAGDPGGAGTQDGNGEAAGFFLPMGLATDAAGNVYVADTANNTIRKITPTGEVTTFAGTAELVGGSTDGTGTAARFDSPQGVAVDASGNVYVADTRNDTVRKITPDGVVTTLAGMAGMTGSIDGTGTAARFNLPSGIVTDSAGNVYVADTLNNAIRKITPAGVITTVAGLAGFSGSTDGTGAAARFDNPTSVTTDSAGNLYVTDTYNNTIRKVTALGVVTTVAGTAGMDGSTDGTGAAARFANPIGVATDSGGNVYVADTYNSTIRKITPPGVVTTFAGSVEVGGSTDGTGAAARFGGPYGLATDSVGNVYATDSGTALIRKITRGG